jgi:uncharacterized protein YndB with AHSA1/START domain
MTTTPIVHDSFAIEITIDAPPAAVFMAYADLRARMEWGAPANDAIAYDKAEFRVGGNDVFRCGPANDMKFVGSLWYHDIVQDERIVYTESVRAGDEKLSLEIVTLELFPEGARTRTRLRSTTQMISFVGPQMIADSKSGTRAALHNLAALVTRASSRR